MTDQSRRLALYRQAEQILVEEAPLVPFAYTRRSLLIKPWVRRFPTSPISEVFWKDVVIEPH
jgi:peptide/nickel transport system substrate-binding protein